MITNIETTMAPIVREEDCGCLVPFGDIRALRETVLCLRDHPDVRDRLGQNGYAAFKKKYNWRLMEERLDGLYRLILGAS